MNETLEKIITALESDGLVTRTAQPADNKESLKYGFNDDPTSFFGRTNSIMQQTVNDWMVKADDHFKVQAGQNAPKYFVFLIDKAEQKSLSDDNAMLFNFNHNAKLSIDYKDMCIQEYKNYNSSDIPGHYIIALGNNNYPEAKFAGDREPYLTDQKLKDYMNHWLKNEADRLKYAGRL